MNGNNILAGLLAVLVVFLGWVAYMAISERRAQTAEATATVLRAEREEKRGDDDTILVLAYRAGAAATEARARIDGVRMSEYPAGRQVRICYNPENPRSVRVTDDPCAG